MRKTSTSIPKKLELAAWHRLTFLFRAPFWTWLGQHLRSRFTVGLALLVPILFSYFILNIFFHFLDGFLGPVFHHYGLDFPGLGLIALIAIIYVSGLIGTNLIGRWFFTSLQEVFLRLPILRTVYSVGRQLTDAFSGNHTPTGLSRVVVTEYLHAGVWTIAFLNGFVTTEDGILHAILYIPTAPLPNSGWLAMVPASQVFDTDINVNTAMRMVVSGGLVYPSTMTRKPLPEATLGWTKASPEPTTSGH